MTATIQIRRDTIANWDSASPAATLAAGEIGIAYDAGGAVHGIKVGPSAGGSWTSLPYLSGTLPILDVSGVNDWNTAALRTPGRFIVTSGVHTWTNGPSGSIALVADDGQATCLSFAYGTTHLHIVTTEGNAAATPNPVPAKMLFRIYDGNAATPAWRDWTPLSLWSSSATTGVDITAKSITLKDTGTGLTVDGNSTLTGNITVNGTTTLGNANADIVTVQAGTASNPIITTTGDTDTGIYFPAANQFAIATGGTAAITVNSSQNVNVAGVLTAAVGTWPQVVQTHSGDDFSYLITSTGKSSAPNVAFLNTTITPRFNTSKILVTVSLFFEASHETYFFLKRSIGAVETEIASSTYPTPDRPRGWFCTPYDGNVDSTPNSVSRSYVDSPNTTSPVTYKLYVSSLFTTGLTVFFNTSVNQTSNPTHETGSSQMILQEYFA